MPYTRQTNFLGGELDTKLWGRTDLPLFRTGLKKCRNFFISKHGAAVSRPGTFMVCETKSANDGEAPRLIPFVYADDTAYVLEFGEEYVRFLLNGGLVYDGMDPLEVETPYTAAEVFELQYAQSGDVLYLTHPNHPPSTLTRYGAVDWQLGEVDFSPPEPYFSDFFDARTFALDPFIVGDLNDPSDDVVPQEWVYLVTVLGEDSRGRRFESKPFRVINRADDLGYNSAEALPASIVVGPGLPVVLAWPNDDTSLDYPYRAAGFCVYRGRGELFGFLGTTHTAIFTDAGGEPDYTIQPPRGINPFEVHDRYGAVTSTERPAAVAFFQDRLWFGGTPQRPATILGSAVGDYGNFDPQQLVHQATESVLFEIASRKREEIRSYLGLSRLVVGTNSSIWSIAGAGGTPLSFDSIDAVREEEIGARKLPFLVVGDTVLYARAKGTGVRSLIYRPSDGGTGNRYFQGSDISAHSQELFNGVTITDWTYAEDPWGLVWVVRSDGSLLSLTLAGESAAWAKHSSSGTHRFESVCAVPAAAEDEVYVVVSRIVGGTPKRFIEKMSSRLTDFCPVDCAAGLIFTWSEQTGDTMVVDQLEHLEGASVYVVASENAYYGPFTVEDGEVTLPEVPAKNTYDSDTGELLDSITLNVGLIVPKYIWTLDFSPDSKLRQKTVVRVGVEVDQSRGLKTGTTPDNTKPWRQRSVGDGYAGFPAATQLVDMAVGDNFNDRGDMLVIQELPLPLTITGVIREVDVGD